MIHQPESESPQPVAEAESLVGVAMHDLLAILLPVLDWYQSDEDDPRPPLDILRDIVGDLQTDRAENLKLRRAAKTALKMARNGRYSAVEVMVVAKAFDSLESILANS